MPLDEKLTTIREEYRRTLEKKQSIIADYSLVKRRLERANTINRYVLSISHEIFNIDSESELCDYILKSLVEIIPGAKAGSFLKVQDGRETMRFVSAIGYDLEELQQLRLELRDTFVFIATDGKMDRPIVIPDIEAFYREYLPDRKIINLEGALSLELSSSISAPIYLNDEIYAMINIDGNDESVFTEQDLQMVQTFTGQMSLALKNFDLIHRIKYLSKYDKLTDVMNRNYFEDHLDHFTSERAKHLSPYVLVLMDLDGLKTINDTYGHAAGDCAIVQFVNTVKEILGPDDLVARIGGDEFIVIFDHARLQEANERMQRLSALLEDRSLEHRGKLIPLRFSYGLSAAPDESMVYEILFKIADDRMYKHKLTKNS
jgi:diguanylate cyclase (GGDEF)-like protein